MENLLKRQNTVCDLSVVELQILLRIPFEIGGLLDFSSLYVSAEIVRNKSVTVREN